MEQVPSFPKYTSSTAQRNLKNHAQVYFHPASLFQFSNISREISYALGVGCNMESLALPSFFIGFGMSGDSSQINAVLVIFHGG